MKINLYLIFLAILAFSFSCNGKNEKTSENKNTDTLALVEGDTLIDLVMTDMDSIPLINDSLFIAQQPLFDSIVEGSTFRDTLLAYFNNAFVNSIDSEAQIQKIFSERGKMLYRIYNIAYDFEENNQGDAKMWGVFEKELNSLGYQTVYAEGMLTSLSILPILQKQVKAVCSPDYQLYLDFLYSEANSFGGEYPYLDLSFQIKMLLLGERMETKYSKSAYNDSIKEAYRFAVKCLTDIHSLDDNSVNQYLLEGISRDFWPNATDISYMEQFVKKHAKSKFAKAIKKILNNTSKLNIGDDPDVGEVYLIVIDSFEKLDEAQDRVFEYLSSGQDIPHTISSKKDGKETYHAVYRFYTDKAIAQEVLNGIQPKYKQAKLVRIDFNWKELE